VTTSTSQIASAWPILFAHWGQDWIRGSERCLLDLIAHIDRERFAPVVLCNSPVFAAAASALDVPVLCDGRYRARDSFFPEWRLAAEARQIVRRTRIQLVHVNSVDLVKWLLPAARMARIPMVAHIHLPSTRIERCYTWAHQVARVVAVSRCVAQEFLDDGLAPERVQVIYNAVDPERLNSGDASSLRRQLGIGQDEIVIVAVASLIHRKGYDLLLPAFARVRRDRPGTRLVIVGDGPDRGALATLAADLGVADAVCFLGERQDAGAILRDVADIAVSTARHETFGLTLIEAGLFALPVAASDIAPHREAVVDGETGLLAAQDPEAIAAVLMRLVDDTPLRRRLGDAGRGRVSRDFLIGRYVQEFQDTYDNLLRGSRKTYGWWGEWTWPSAYSQWIKGAIRRRLALKANYAGSG
jgi:glycosyltransferase involved in cell wall biosynthesis